MGSLGLYENRVLLPNPFRCFSADVRQFSRTRKEALDICRIRDKQRKSYKPFEEPFLVDERNLDDRFPILCRPVEVQLKVQWVEMEDQGIGVVH